MNKYRLDEIIDVNSQEEIPLFTVEQSRNQFFIPLLIFIFIIILNILYKGIYNNQSLITETEKLFTFQDGELVLPGFFNVSSTSNPITTLKTYSKFIIWIIFL